MRLSLKQRNFVKKYIENGGNGTQAAMDVYNAKNTNVAHAIASENLRKPTIQREIELSLERAGLTDDYVSELLRDATVAGLGTKATNADSLRGIDMLLRIKQAYPDKVTKSAHLRIETKDGYENKTFQQAVEELRELQEKTARLLEDIKKGT